MANMSRKSRKSTLSRLTKDYQKTAIIFATELEETYRRNEERGKTGKYIRNDVYEKMMSSFIVPTYGDFDIIEWRF